MNKFALSFLVFVLGIVLGAGAMYYHASQKGEIVGTKRMVSSTKSLSGKFDLDFSSCEQVMSEQFQDCVDGVFDGAAHLEVKKEYCREIKNSVRMESCIDDINQLEQNFDMDTALALCASSKTPVCLDLAFVLAASEQQDHSHCFSVKDAVLSQYCLDRFSFGGEDPRLEEVASSCATELCKNALALKQEAFTTGIKSVCERNESKEDQLNCEYEFDIYTAYQTLNASSCTAFSDIQKANDCQLAIAIGNGLVGDTTSCDNLNEFVRPVCLETVQSGSYPRFQ